MAVQISTTGTTDTTGVSDTVGTSVEESGNTRTAAIVGAPDSTTSITSTIATTIATTSSDGVEDSVSRTEARRRLGLEPGEFRSALELGEIVGAGRRVPLSEVRRLLAEPGFPEG